MATTDNLYVYEGETYTPEKLRCKILRSRGHSPQFKFNVAGFSGATYKQFEKLKKYDLIDTEGSQNCSPTAGEFIEFIHEHPGFTAHGYIVPDCREDARVTIEGVEFHGKYTLDELRAFARFCHPADEFVVGDVYLRSWWD